MFRYYLFSVYQSPIVGTIDRYSVCTRTYCYFVGIQRKPEIAIRTENRFFSFLQTIDYYEWFQISYLEK